MKKNAGRFDIRLIIQKPSEVIENGEPVVSWSEYYSTWANRKQVPTDEKEGVEAMQRVSSDYTEFTIRYPLHIAKPTTKMIVVETDGTEYDIENIRIEGRKECLVLVCKQKQQR